MTLSRRCGLLFPIVVFGLAPDALAKNIDLDVGQLVRRCYAAIITHFVAMGMFHPGRYELYRSEQLLVVLVIGAALVKWAIEELTK